VGELNWDGVLSPSDSSLPHAVATESGLRTRSVDELRESLTPYLKDYGITRVAHLTGFDHVGLPVHMAVKPQGKTLSSGSGKGSVPNASWVSAVMECAEQSVWENLTLETVNATASTMRRLGLTIVDPTTLQTIKGAPEALDIPLDWVPGWDIVNGCETYVPEPCVGVARGWVRAYRPFSSGSNGLASGAHVLEAVLSGLQEVIERDGMTLNTWATRPQAFDSTDFLRIAAPSVAERIEKSGLRLEVTDCRTDIGVPTIVAHLFDDVGNTGSFKGSGAGTSNRTALTRAVTEAAQSRCLIISGARDDIFESSRTAAVANSTMSPAQSLLPFSDDFSFAAQSILEAIEWMVERLTTQGFNQVVVIRHSQPGDPVQVVRVIVPGLEGYPYSYARLGKRFQTFRQQQSLKTESVT
jgi:ribosomal protein S12 methylthiotransferase accessory factor